MYNSQTVWGGTRMEHQKVQGVGALETDRTN